MSSNFIVKFFNAVSNGIVNNNVLNRSIHTGVMDIPYASMGLITVAVGTFTYVTYMDYISDIGNDISETIDDIQKSSPFEYNQENDNSEPMGFLSSLGISDQQPEIQNNSESNAEPINEKNEEEPEKEEEKKEETEQKEETEKKEEKEKEQPGEQYSLGGKSKSRKAKNKKRRKITNKKRR